MSSLSWVPGARIPSPKPPSQPPPPRPVDDPPSSEDEEDYCEPNHNPCPRHSIPKPNSDITLGFKEVRPEVGPNHPLATSSSPPTVLSSPPICTEPINLLSTWNADPNSPLDEVAPQMGPDVQHDPDKPNSDPAPPHQTNADLMDAPGSPSVLCGSPVSDSSPIPQTLVPVPTPTSATVPAQPPVNMTNNTLAVLPSPHTMHELTAELQQHVDELMDDSMGDRFQFAKDFGKFCRENMRLECEAQVYGSSACGLCLKGSDVDIYLEVKRPSGTEMTKNEARRLLGNMEKLLKKVGLKDVHLIADARVPVVQTRIKEGQGMWRYSFDINVTDRQGHMASQVLGCYVKQDVRLQQLALLLKRLLSCTVLNDAKRGYLCTYGWILCLVAFLQCRPQPVLPTFKLTGEFCSTNDETLGELFVDFFRWMAEFDWKNLYICTLKGAPQHRGEFPGESQQGRCMVIEDILLPGQSITRLRTGALQSILSFCTDIHETLLKTRSFAHLLTQDYRGYSKRRREDDDAEDSEPCWISE